MTGAGGSGGAHGAKARSNRPPARSGLARAAGVGTVAVLLGVGAFLAGIPARAAPRTALQPFALAARAAPASSQSSSWYCTGGAGPSTPVAPSRIVLVNAGARAVRGALRVTDSHGRSAAASFRVPAGAQRDEVPGALVPGPWVAARVDVAGGALSAEEVVQGPAGWSVAPCASEMSPRWYFAGGSTAAGDTLHVALYDPAPALAVVDLSFVTASGTSSPAPYQGLVIAPRSLHVVTVGRYVQDKTSVATVVNARSGTVVATELEHVTAGGAAGVALSLGAPAPSSRWLVPHAVDPVGGASQLSVFNPSAAPAHVRVDVRLGTGPVAPFEQVVAPSSVWTLQTSAQLRVPPGADYAAEVSAPAGSGVVVGRQQSGTPGGPPPQWGSLVPTSSALTEARRWVLPEVGTGPGAPAGAQANVLVALENPGRRAVVVTVSALTRAGPRRVARLALGPHRFASVTARKGPLLVTAGGPVAVAGDVSGTGAAGLFGIPAIPQS